MDPLEAAIEEIKKEFGEDSITTTNTIDRPQESLDRDMFVDFNERNPMMDGGMLVQPSADGSRPGYAKQKPLTNTELKIFNNYLKARKDMKLDAPTDKNKEKIKSKVRVGDIDNNTIKNMKEKYRYENVNQQLRYDTKLKRWEKTINKGKNYIQKAGETKTQFLKRVENIASKAQTTARKKQDVSTSKTRTYIDNWTKNWLDNNLEKYGVRDFDKMTTNLKNDWQKNIKNLDIDKGFVQNLSTKSGLPNVTAKGENAFDYKGSRFYTSAEVTKAPLSQWRGLFFKDKIQNTPGFKQKILDYFDFINLDKRGLYMQEGGQTVKAYKQIADKDVIYLLSPDANLLSSAKYNLFNSIDDNFSEAYNNYTRKINRSIQWRTSATAIEKALGLKPNFIKNSMDKEKKALAKIFDVKQLPEELRYTLEHAQGISAAARTGDKTIMQAAVNDLIGTTIKQNKALGFGGFEANRNALIRDITAGVNVKDNLKSLNSLSRNAYKDFGIKGNIYSLKDGKITTSSISPALTQEERFVQYFKELDKTEEGSAAIKKQAGSLKNLEQKILQNIQSYSKLKQCRVNQADGGRIGFKFSNECIRDGLKEQKIEAQKGNKKAAQELVQVGKVATRAGLLKNLLGPGAILGEAVFEGALIANKVLGGKPADIAYAESYLSYLDPRKYSGQLDPLKMRREDMTTREIEDADGNIKTIDGPNANILRSGFAAQDQLSAFNKALLDRDIAKARGRTDQYLPAAPDAREQGRFADQSADIISSEAFKDASNMAQEYIQGQEGQRMFPYNQFKQSIGRFESGENRDYRRRKEEEMKNLYTQFSDNQLMDMLENSKSLKAAGITPEQYMLLLGAGTKRITPAVTRTLSGLDAVRTDIQEQEALNRIAKAGGVANLARGGRAGFKLGKLIKLKKSKVREDAKAIIDDSMKMQQEIDTTTELDKLIKKTLDEDLFDKKDRIVDSINISEAKKRRNYPYNMQVFEEPKNLDFYRDIKESDFRTKTGPYYDRIRRNKAGGGLLKLAGDRSGPPPESGPNSQGLQGLLNRVKNT